MNTTETNPPNERPEPDLQQVKDVSPQVRALYLHDFFEQVKADAELTQMREWLVEAFDDIVRGKKDPCSLSASSWDDWFLALDCKETQVVMLLAVAGAVLGPDLQVPNPRALQHAVSWWADYSPTDLRACVNCQNEMPTADSCQKNPLEWLPGKPDPIPFGSETHRRRYMHWRVWLSGESDEQVKQRVDRELRKEALGPYATPDTRCADCGVAIGGYHHSECHNEECPRCHMGLLGHYKKPDCDLIRAWYERNEIEDYSYWCSDDSDN